MNDKKTAKLKRSLSDKLVSISSPLNLSRGSIKVALEKRYLGLFREHVRVIVHGIKEHGGR